MNISHFYYFAFFLVLFAQHWRVPEILATCKLLVSNSPVCLLGFCRRIFEFLMHVRVAELQYFITKSMTRYTFLCLLKNTPTCCMLYVTVFDNLRAGSTAACRQLPTVIRRVGWQQRMWPRDATWSPGHLPSYHLSTGYQHHHHHHHDHHYHYQHLNHRAHYHHDHYPHDDADHHDHHDDQTITDWSVCDVENRRMDSGKAVTTFSLILLHGESPLTGM